MNVVSRGIKNAFRSPIRSGTIILMLAISIGLILSMLVAKSSVEAKINDVKANAGTNITIRPAGVNGFAGGGNLLTSDQIATVTKTAHISSVTSTLQDQLGTSDTNLTSSLELGSFGQRQQRFEGGNSNSQGSDNSSDSTSATTLPAMTPRITITGTTDQNSISTSGSALTLTSGEPINGASSDLIALVGTDLATKNSLSVGSTFTAYDKTITVKGIYKTDNKFQDSGLIMPLATVQSLTSQANSISNVTAKVDSSDNVSSVVSSLKTSLGDKADIVSEAEVAANSVSSLQGISSLALGGVIGSAIAGAVIMLLAMVIIVRERRREIGVIKAIGGSDGKVIAQFVTEAISITVVGAIVGLVLGVLVSGPMTTSLVSSQTSSSQSASGSGRGPDFAIREGFGQIGSNLTKVTSSVTPTTFATAVGLTFIIAIIGSAVPAWFISKIRPSEVLRND